MVYDRQGEKTFFQIQRKKLFILKNRISKLEDRRYSSAKMGETKQHIYTENIQGIKLKISIKGTKGNFRKIHI